MPFSETFRRMPTANAEGWVGSEGGVGEVSVRRVFRYRSDRHGPSACAEVSRKKNLFGVVERERGLLGVERRRRY